MVRSFSAFWYLLQKVLPDLFSFVLLKQHILQSSMKNFLCNYRIYFIERYAVDQFFNRSNRMNLVQGFNYVDLYLILTRPLTSTAA